MGGPAHTCQMHKQGPMHALVSKKKWHEMVKSAPSIPKRNKVLTVPNDDDTIDEVSREKQSTQGVRTGSGQSTS